MSIQNYYQEKYLKYKKKYFQLKMSGGANCANMGFTQHQEECWNDSLSMISCYCDGIGETIQEIFRSEESFTEFITNIDINELNGIPLELLPPNFDLDKEDDKKKLLHLSKEYIKELYKRYLNEKKIDLTPTEIEKIKALALTLTPEQKELIKKYIVDNNKLYYDAIEPFNNFLDNKPTYDDTHEYYNWYINNLIKIIKETRILNPKPSGLFRQNSVEISFQCVNYIYQISNHNRSNELMFNYTHIGTLNEDYIILGIISYFLLNYPIKKKVNPIKILQRAQSVQEEIAEETEINQKKIARSLSMEYEQEQKSLNFLSSKTFEFYMIFTNNNEVKNIIDKLNQMKDNIKDALCILIGVQSGIDRPRDGYHVQCFFTCEKKLYFYDNQGIKIDGKVIYFINFNWKSYLNEIIDNVIKSITNSNKNEMYKQFSQFYYDLLKYPTTNSLFIKHFVIIKNEKYTKELFKVNLLNNLKTHITRYNNKTIINHLKNNNIESETLFELLNNLLMNNDLFNDIYPVMQELIKKDNIEQCFTIKNYEGYTFLHTLIKKGNLNVFKLFISHPKIKNSFSIQSDGYSPLYYVMRFDYEDYIKLILEMPNIEEYFTIRNDPGGDTVLNAAIIGKIEFLKLLLSKPEIEKCFTIQDENGNTPLHIALISDKVSSENRDELLKHPKISISYDIKNNKGLTPRDIATTNNIELL